LETALAKASEQDKKVMVTLIHVTQGKRQLSDDFKNYANDNLVLVSVDRRKGRGQSDKDWREETKLFITLFKKYKVNRFPTSIVIDAEGNELMRNIGPINSKTLELLKKLDDDSKDEKKEAK